MITPHRHIKHEVTLIILAIATTVVVVFAGAGTALAAPPVKLALSSHITNGFEYPASVAVNNDPHSPEYRDVYVLDRNHYRVQVLSPTGVFVEMFGQEVNETTKGNVCTARSGNTCQAGVQGPAPGQFSLPFSLAVDPSDGNVFVAERVEPYEEFGQRVQEFTAEGQFVLEIGKEVNTTRDTEPLATTAQKNLCGELEMCGAPGVYGSQEDGAFKFEEGHGNLLAVGGTGSKDLLYVGEEGRVQEFEAASGNWAGEIPLTSLPVGEASKSVEALAFDQESGNVYLVYGSGGNIVREFDHEDNAEVANIALGARHEHGEVHIEGLAVDSVGDLAVVGVEPYDGTEHQNEFRFFGSLYNVVSGSRIAEFVDPGNNGRPVDALAFNGERDLYAVVNAEVGEVLAYTPEPIGELTIGGSGCAPGVESNTSMTFACTLEGEVNPEGVPGTKALFEYGRTPNLGETTTPEKISTTEPVHTVVSLRPNEKYYYKLAGFDNNLMPPEEPFASEQASLTTETVAPHIGTPSLIAATPSSAVLFSELNPENAATEYHFEYAQSKQALAVCAPAAKEHGGCPGVQSTPVEKSSVYVSIGAKAEITGLQPGTTYHYRLFAEDESRIKAGERLHTTGPEASFTTEPTPLPSAHTGTYTAVTPTGATITGAVNPDGTPAEYAFELGVYNGTSTQYTIVYSAEAGSGTSPVEESLPLTGLQPGTTYAYRIAVSSGYIANEAHALRGEAMTFTTAGIPAVLVSPTSLAQLPIPAIAFPTETAGSGTSTSKGLTRAQKLAAALKVCKRQRHKAKRTKCERAAHKSYGPAKAARK
jgi:hypothetical protein